MDEHHQAAAVHRQPRNHLAKQGWFEGQLAAPVGVRADRLFMHAAHLQRETCGGGFTQGACLRHGAGVEINVGVKAVDGGMGGSNRVHRWP